MQDGASSGALGVGLGSSSHRTVVKASEYVTAGGEGADRWNPDRGHVRTAVFNVASPRVPGSHALRAARSSLHPSGWIPPPSPPPIQLDLPSQWARLSLLLFDGVFSGDAGSVFSSAHLSRVHSLIF